MFFRYLPLFILDTFLVAQEETRPTVAILDFEGQDMIFSFHPRQLHYLQTGLDSVIQ